MADDIETTIYNAHLEGRSKYVYFLLAAAGACIAFAVNQTQTAALAWSQIPLALAVLCWGTSFSFGCWHLQQVGGALYDNMDLIKVQRGKHRITGRDIGAINQISDMLRAGIQKSSSRSVLYYRWQFYMLIIGAVFFIAWHITSMYLRLHK
jgi:hypothetical protein